MGLQTTTSCPQPAPDVTAKTPPTPTGARTTWRQTGQMAFIIPITFITHCPDEVMGIIIIMPYQVSGRFLPLKAKINSVWYLIWFDISSLLQSMSTRKSRISGQGSMSGPARCLVKGPKWTDASPTAWALVTVWRTRGTWSPWAPGPPPRQPLTTHTTWTLWPKPKL